MPELGQLARCAERSRLQQTSAAEKDRAARQARNINETTVARAASLAWDHGLRGYDAVHLATALLWRELLDTSVTLATFDRQLWNAASESGFVMWPDVI